VDQPTRPQWWTYPTACHAGHPWTPGKVIVSGRRATALAVARHLQDATGTSIKKIVQALRTARSATIEINGQRITLDPDLTAAARDILQRLETGH
jgi:hypothetical protein